MKQENLDLEPERLVSEQRRLNREQEWLYSVQ
jgi:hypothetical protein